MWKLTERAFTLLRALEVDDKARGESNNGSSPTRRRLLSAWMNGESEE